MIIDNDVYICFVYMTLKKSTVFHYTDADYWSNLEDELAKYQCKCEVILMGDFIARTATLPDYILPADRSNHNECIITEESDITK